jgi:probable rRNA maturation factor
MATINFFSQGTSFKLPNPKKISSWIKRVAKIENHSPKALNFIFCSDEYLLDINIRYLRHKTYTDIITFDNSDEDEFGIIEGDIYVSIDRVKENAKKLNIIFTDELHRVIIHGVLHLLGYSDKTKAQIREMRKKEDAYLSLR